MQLLNKINAKYLNKERNHIQNMHIPHLSHIAVQVSMNS